MIINLNKKHILHQTEQYQLAGLTHDFLSEMSKVVSALQAAGYEPYDQLYGYIMHGNDQYITRHGGAREIVTKILFLSPVRILRLRMQVTVSS